jgi:hypothetical protein
MIGGGRVVLPETTSGVDVGGLEYGAVRLRSIRLAGTKAQMNDSGKKLRMLVEASSSHGNSLASISSRGVFLESADGSKTHVR